MENEFYPLRSRAFQNAASRIVEDYRDEALSPRQKQEDIAKYIRNTLANHLKHWPMSKILAVIQGKMGVESIKDVYADGIVIYKILQSIHVSPQMPHSDKMSFFFEGNYKRNDS